MLPSHVVAQTSQNLEMGFEVPEMFYFQFDYWAEGYMEFSEDMYCNATAIIGVIPDPLTNFTEIPDVTIDFKYLNGTDAGMFVMALFYAMKVAVPIGNWSLMTALVENVTGFDIGEVFPVVVNQTVDDWLHWGFHYNVSIPGSINTVDVTYLKSDGFVSAISVKAYDSMTQDPLGTLELIRDGTAPVVSHPADITYNVSDTGNEISWSATDQSPAGYIVYKDDVEVTRGMWTSSSQNIVVDVDGLTAGLYEYEIEFYEASGISASDVVTVNVTAGETTDTGTDTGTGTGTGDFISENLMLIVGVGGAVVILIVIVIIMKKR